MNDDLLNRILEELQIMRMLLELSAPKDLKKPIEERLASIEEALKGAEAYDIVARAGDDYGKQQIAFLQKQRDMYKAYLSVHYPLG